jgi:hypothetical protein
LRASRALWDLGYPPYHDALNVFSGLIRIFVEHILRSNQFGAAGFVHSNAWSQFRPDDGGLFQKQRASLEHVAALLTPFVKNGKQLHGLRKIRFQLKRSRVPRTAIRPSEWISLPDIPT